MQKIALTIPDYTINPPSGIPQGGDKIQNIIQFGIIGLLVIGIILSVFFLILAGIKWITSGGDQKSIEAARKIVTFTVIGLVVVLGSFLILNTITGFFGVSYLH